MDYFKAVQEGRLRVQAAIDLLQPIVGPCYPMLFLKLGVTDWTPVGTDMLYSIVDGKEGTIAVVICDGEGNSKAMSTWNPRSKAEEFESALATKGVGKFEGEVKLPI